MADAKLLVSDFCDAMAEIAPPELAQDWDNVGLLIGDPDSPLRRVLLCIDLTPAVLDEAQDVGASAVLAYHPTIFKPLRSLTPASSPVAYEAVRRNIAVYSPHTALDVVNGGPNDMLADVLGLERRQCLEPAEGARRCKVVTFAPETDLDALRDAAFEAGAGRIGLYDRCSFCGSGEGTFLPGAQARPAKGRAGHFEKVPEMRLEVICPGSSVHAVSAAIREAHSYEEPPVDVYDLSPMRSEGLGRVGDLSRPARLGEILARIKSGLGVDRVWTARGAGGDDVIFQRGACCAGSCSSLFRVAAAKGARVYLTGEMRHHDALAASAMGMTVVCVGHSNSERPILADVAKRLGEHLPGLETAVSQVDADPFTVD